MEGLESTFIFDITMILQVVLIDLALGGDNSIVIGMAAKNLPKHLQKRAILYGTAGAICLRFIMAFIVSWLFQIPFLKTVGAILLIIIGIKLIGADDASEEDIHVEAKDSLWAAVRTIIMADALMSLDNVLGIVGVTNNHWGLLMLGMFISVPIIIFGSTIVVKVMNKFPILIYLGGAILGWASGGMMATDHYLAQYVSLAANNPDALKIILLIVTVGGGFIWKRIHKKA
ncbi:integral membrane protein, YjbE family [Megasphaera elsdenii]|uniref:TerC family protein n=1 Tax=Megasphaera elsdenii TaxID=907 RepID=UPI0008EAD15D|nr:TerC family protein [Megasphaera elsdenii]SFI32000.1 integral membrane protein, YjbE family [Megasphaera elsdenii]